MSLLLIKKRERSAVREQDNMGKMEGGKDCNQTRFFFGGGGGGHNRAA